MIHRYRQMEDTIMKRISIILAALVIFVAAALVMLPGTAALAAGPKKVTLPPYG